MYASQIPLQTTHFNTHTQTHTFPRQSTTTECFSAQHRDTALLCRFIHALRQAYVAQRSRVVCHKSLSSPPPYVPPSLRSVSHRLLRGLEVVLDGFFFLFCIVTLISYLSTNQSQSKSVSMSQTHVCRTTPSSPYIIYFPAFH